MCAFSEANAKDAMTVDAKTPKRTVFSAGDDAKTLLVVVLLGDEDMMMMMTRDEMNEDETTIFFLFCDKNFGTKKEDHKTFFVCDETT